MSEKAVGTDWKKRSTYTLRHAAGANKYRSLINGTNGQDLLKNKDIYW